MAQIEKRGNSYRIRASSGYTVSGKQIRPSATWTPDPKMTARQIEKELQRQVVLFEDRCKSMLGNGHFKFEVFIDQYFEEYAKPNLRERTRSSYAAYQPRVTAALGHLYLDKISPRHIKTFILNLAEPGMNQRTGGGLSHKSIKNYLGFLSSLFTYAIELGLISENPCTNITPPAETKTSDKEWYTLDEAQALLNSLDEAPLKYQAYITLAIFCGYRREELGGLEWGDIDFSKKIIAINRASLYTKERGTYTDTTKTKAAKRAQKQQDIVFDALKKWRSEQSASRLALGDQWEDSGRVFTGDFGAPLHPNTPYTWLQRHCKAHGLRFLGVHALRHLNASLRITAGADVRTVAAALGHAQASTTLNIYAYEFAEVQAASSEAIADLLTQRSQQNGKLS